MNKGLEKDIPIVSIMVLSFNNFKYIFEALDSIFIQTYPKIQLVISDDASKDFREKRLRRYILRHKKNNIVDFIINKNVKNMGTVQHLKYIRNFCTGNLLTSIAADDAYADPDAISVLVDAYNEYNGEVPFITSLAVMSDTKLCERKSVFTSDADIQLINSGDTKKLFEELSYRCIMSASGTLVERSLYEKIGDFDDYTFIEDWSMHLRLARLGVKMKCVNRVTYLHRDGGVSHGNKRATNEVFLKYYRDLLTLYEKEVEPYADGMTKYTAKRAKQYYLDRVKRYELESQAFSGTGLPKIVFYCRKGISAKGDFILYYRIASYIAEHYDYDVYCINNSVPELQEKYLDSKIHFCNITSNNVKYFEGATFVVAVNQVFCLLEEIAPLKKAKFLFLFLHPEIVSWLSIQMTQKFFNFKKISRLCARTNSFAFQDEANYIAYLDRNGYRMKKPHYFPVIIDESNLKTEIQPVRKGNVVNIAWLGRIDKDKVFSIVNCLNNLYENVKDKEIYFHLLGDGDAKSFIRIPQYAPKIKIIFSSFLFGETRDQYLKENVDLVLAMGMSALDVAVLGIPTILPIVSMKPFDSNTFLYLFNTRNYCIGWAKENLEKVDCKTNTIEEIVYDIYDREQKVQIGNKCREFVINNFSIERNVQNIIQLVEGSTLTKSRLLRNPSIAFQWIYFKLYKKFLRPHADYVLFLTFKKKVEALRKKPIKEQIKMIIKRLKKRKK